MHLFPDTAFVGLFWPSPAVFRKRSVKVGNEEKHSARGRQSKGILQIDSPILHSAWRPAGDPGKFGFEVALLAGGGPRHEGKEARRGSNEVTK